MNLAARAIIATLPKSTELSQSISPEGVLSSPDRAPSCVVQERKSGEGLTHGNLSMTGVQPPHQGRRGPTILPPFAALQFDKIVSPNATSWSPVRAIL